MVDVKTLMDLVHSRTRLIETRFVGGLNNQIKLDARFCGEILTFLSIAFTAEAFVSFMYRNFNACLIGRTLCA